MQIYFYNWHPKVCADKVFETPVRARRAITNALQILACGQKHFFGFVTLRKADGQSFFSTHETYFNHPLVQNWVIKDIKHMKWLTFYLFDLYQNYKWLWKTQGFSNVPGNLKILMEQLKDVELDEKGMKEITFYNFAKCDAKGLDFTHMHVFEAYKELLRVQEE